MNLYKDIPTWVDENENIVNAIVEIWKDSMVKYEFNKELNIVEVDRFFTTPMPIPYNYGLLPQTFNKEDGDPLDIILLSCYSIMPWTLVKAKVIWILHMIDSWESDDKIIAVPLKEPFLGKFDNVDQLKPITRQQIEFFLSHYKKIDGKVTEVTGWEWPEIAKKVINQCIQDYKNK